MKAEMDGRSMLTNEKIVITFVSPTKAYASTSRNSRPELDSSWIEYTETDVVIDGNKVTLTGQRDEHSTVVMELTINDINTQEFTAVVKGMVLFDGKEMLPYENSVRYSKITADYSAAIVGTWQGRCTSEGSVFDDGQEHRWQYNADGTYVYYVKDSDNWVPYADNTLNQYFVDGTLLCTRWVDNGVENREWWEITIASNKMNWTALRQNADGTTFTATFEMERVE
jgi:hypothetical protein